MNKNANNRVRMDIEITGHESLVNALAQEAKRRGISRSKLCEEILSAAVGGHSFCGKCVTSRKTDKVAKTREG